MALVRSPLINVISASVRKAARGLVRDFGEIEQLQVSKKGPGDFVSAADRRAEIVLKKELQRVRPSYSFLMEETGAVEGEDPSNVWVIDPLDGTNNFVHSIPHFCISVGLVRDGEPVAGVIYQPLTDEMFWAEKGSGAYMNDRRLRVSARNRIDEAMIGTGLPPASQDKRALWLRQLDRVMASNAGIRRSGAAALDLCAVASGRYDGYWEFGLFAWDLAAGILIVREAGGYVTEIDGGNDMLNTGSILAANTDLHQDLGKILKGA